MYIYIYMLLHNDLMRDHVDLVMLCSTTDSYGRLVIAVAYGEILAQNEWLGGRHDASPMFDIPGLTLVWATYMIFSSFHDVKIYMYYILKNHMYYKRNIGGP